MMEVERNIVAFINYSKLYESKIIIVTQCESEGEQFFLYKKSNELGFKVVNQKFKNKIE